MNEKYLPDFLRFYYYRKIRNYACRVAGLPLITGLNPYPVPTGGERGHMENAIRIVAMLWLITVLACVLVCWIRCRQIDRRAAFESMMLRFRWMMQEEWERREFLEKVRGEVLMHLWQCDKCGWTGDYPDAVHPEYEDGGYPCCPNGCKDDQSEPQGVALNPIHPDNQRKYARALMKASY